MMYITIALIRSHHHVMIHVPYKIHTIHKTILKHVHHKGGEDKYEVLGYTVGRPIDFGHHFGGHEQLQEHEFGGGGNELGHGHQNWAPISYDYHEQAHSGVGGGGGDGHQRLQSHAEEFAARFAGHGGFNGYEEPRR